MSDVTWRSESLSCSLPEEPVGFESATAAAKIPAKLPAKYEMLIWGVHIHKPEHFEGLVDQLAPTVLAQRKTTLYVADWSVIEFQDTCGGEALFSAWEPRLDLDHYMSSSLTPWGAQNLARRWPVTNPDATPFHMSCLFEQPFGFLSLEIFVVGNVILHFRPEKIVADTQLNDQFYFDHTRTRQLEQIKREIVAKSRDQQPPEKL